MYIIMNGRSTWRYEAPAYPSPANHSRRRAPARSEVQPRTPRRCRPHPYLLRLYRSTPGNKGAYALRRFEGDTAHFWMVTFWESEVAIRAFAGEDISLATYYDFDKDFLLELVAVLHTLRDVRPVSPTQVRILSACSQQLELLPVSRLH